MTWRQLFLVCIALALSACGGATPAATTAAATSSQLASLVDAASKEGTVVVYGPPGTPYRQMLVNDFEKAYPSIKVDALFVAPTERMSRVSLERQAGQYLADLWISGTTPVVTDVKDARYTASLKDQLLPDVLDPNVWFQHRLWWADAAEPLTVLMFAGSVQPVIFVNSKMVDPSQFHSYWDLLDPKWKGKMASTDIRLPGPGAAPARALFKDASVGPAFFTRLFAEESVTLSSDQSQLVDWVAQGTYPIGLFLSFNEVELAVKQGLPIKAVAADQLKEAPAIGPANGAAAMLDKAPHPAASKLYLNWLLSKEGQTMWQKDVGDNSLRTDIPKDVVDPLLVPKDGVTYVDSGSEAFSRAFNPNTLRQPIDEGLQKAGAK